MLRVGLTGGIACGKSHTLVEFHRKGVYTIDADEIAHEVILPNRLAYKKILRTFGPKLLSPDKTIDRHKLGKLIFEEERARRKLNQIVHPFVIQEIDRRISEFKALDNPRSPIIMVDAALMIETGSYEQYDLLIVVYCPPTIQLKRLMNREGLSKQEADQRISSQMPVLEKIKYADHVIENSKCLSELRSQVVHLFQKLISYHEKTQHRVQS